MNYGQLKSNIAGWINRGDLTSVIPTFVDLARDRIFFGSPDLGVQPLRTLDMLTVVSPFSGTTLPSDWIELKRVSWFLDGTIKYPLEFLPLEKIGPYEGISGRPQYFSVRGNTIVYGPTFSNNVELMYYAVPAAMVADGDADFLLTNAPSVYLQACLMEAAIYLKDAQAAQLHGQAFANAMKAYQNQDDGSARSGATLRIRSDSRVAV